MFYSAIKRFSAPFAMLGVSALLFGAGVFLLGVGSVISATKDGTTRRVDTLPTTPALKPRAPKKIKKTESGDAGGSGSGFRGGSKSGAGDVQSKTNTDGTSR